ncbi:MAG: leucine-rich repeat protein [Clostridia bacterium]|nr:leucine-rich repeat protein [Clostridia bacterium]
MKTKLHRLLACLLCAVLLLGLAPLSGFVWQELPYSSAVFAVKAHAETYGDLSYQKEDGQIKIVYCNTYASGDLAIPAELEGLPVTRIDQNAFENCTRLTSVTMPESVVSIGSSAFSGCTGLTQVTIPDSVTSMGSSAFIDCTGLTHATIPDSVTSIEDEAFRNCLGLTSITFGKSVTHIGYEAFQGCTGLTSIMIPDSVTSIGYNAFGSCTGLTSITIGNSVKSIDHAFEFCDGLTSVTVSEDNPVYHSAGNCLIETASKTLVFGCKTSIIPADGSVTSIGESAFAYCDELTNITIPDSVTSIESCAFFGCTGLTSIAIPGSVSSISLEAFYNCTGLTMVTIGSGVTSIGGYAFYYCTKLTSVTIPDSVTSINYSAFSCCTGLTDVYYQGTKAEWNKITIGSNNERLLNARLHYTLTATFVVDGEVYATETFTATQESIREPDVPEKPGYTARWSPYILNAQDITIEAIYKPITYYATFMADGAQVGEAIPFTVLTDSITPPAVPEKTGYTGVWQPFTLGTADLTIEAVYTQNTYYATIIADGAAIAKIPFVYGQKSITLPDVPKKEGHTGAWPTYTLPAHDITIEAVYTPIEYTVIYLVDGQSIGSGPIPYGNPVWQPRIPQKEGYTFDGWTPKVPATMPAEDLTFTAVFKANSYTVTWIVDGAEYKTETVLFGASLTPPTPEKEGSTFSGWDAEVPAAMPAKDLTFRGSFTLNQYTLRLISDGVELVNTRVAHGAPFQLLTAPTKAGYTLLGWADDPAAATAAYAVGGTYTFNADTTLYAVWQKNDTPPAAQPTIQIKNYTPTRKVKFKTTMIFTATTSDAPDGAVILWFVNDNPFNTGETCTVEKATADYTVQAKLIGADGSDVTVLAESEIETIDVPDSFFEKLVAFFRNLFGALPVIAQRAF